MNVVDIFCLCVIAFFAGRGIWRGFVNEWAGLLGALLGYWAIRLYSATVASWLMDVFELSDSTGLLMGKISVFLGVYLGVVLLGKLLTKVLKLVWLGWINRLVGGVSGLLKGFVFVALVWALYTHFLLPRFRDTLSLYVGSSWVYDLVAWVGRQLLDLGHGYLSPAS